MEEYSDDQLLMLSGVQHFIFCKRQWALIHLENQWQENVRTIAGNIAHEKCHDNSIVETRGDLVIVRGLNIVSYKLGLSGQCDVVEFHRRNDGQGAILSKHTGTWDIVPVEYKVGKPKQDIEDIAQLCGQALCLEEIFGCDVKEGYLFYVSMKRRQKVVFDDNLRAVVKNAIEDMHTAYLRGTTPKVKAGKKCKQCSLQDLCLPDLFKRKSVQEYYEKFLEDDE